MILKPFHPHHNMVPERDESVQGQRTRGYSERAGQESHWEEYDRYASGKVYYPRHDEDVPVLLIFLKRKRNGLIKATGCAGGRPQQEYINKLESSSQCMKTHALFLSCIVDTFENKCVVVADIPAVFLSANWPEDVLDCHIRFEGVMVEMLRQIKPEYSKLIKYSRRKDGRLRKLLVGKISKAIYGTLLGAIQFYKKLRGVLIDMGFQTNGYDECTFNKMINGYQQCTIQVHVDNLKLSYETFLS